MDKSTTRAFQKVLNSVTLPSPEGNFADRFAIKRFLKKFEIPSEQLAEERKQLTFSQWVQYDESLKQAHLLPGEWYRARLMIHEVMKHYRTGDLQFTSGSSSEPLHGMQSIADKLLTHDWEVTPDCADLFVDLAVNDKAFVKAAKIRVRRCLGDSGYRSTVRRIWRYRSSSDDVKRYLLYSCLKSREASRFSTVRKNNSIDRAIDLQPFINMAVQRAIGVGLRSILRSEFGVDLLGLQDVHRKMVSDKRWATIDLRNASDSNTWSLVSFLYPRWFVSLLRKATPLYVEGLDGHYYMTKKVSSMGNGFTFELMTLTLLAVGRVVNPTTSVFGDDIIVDKVDAVRLMAVLRGAGWVVNEEKSFIDGPFRESCGANFHDDYGYIESYDFEYPQSIGDCIVFYNKLNRLKHIPFFRMVHSLLSRTIPVALRGGCPLSGISVGHTPITDVELDGWFHYGPNSSQPRQFEVVARAYQWDKWFYHESYVYVTSVRFSKRDNIRMSKHSLLYFAYMQSGRKSDVVFTGRGDWVKVGMLSDGRHSIRVKSVSLLFDDLKVKG